jgi:iron complex outermembrane recepter protein
VQVRTRDPQAEPSADIEAGYANYNTPSGTFYGTTGIAANLAADIALAAREQYTGWGTNLYTGKDDAFVSRDFNARSKWLWSPTDSTRVTMILSFNKDRSSDGAVLHTLPGDSWRAPNPDGTNPGPTVYTYHGFYNVDVKNLGFGDTRSGGGSLKIEQKFDPVDFASISSYQDESSQLVLSADSTPADWENLNFWSSERTFTQEFHLLSSEHSTAPLRWIVGTFLYYDKGSADPYTISGNALGPVSPVIISSTMYTHSYAAFGETTYTIAQKTHVTAGLRYTEDYRAYNAVQTLGSPPFITIPQLSGPNPTDPPGTFRKKYDKPTWTFAINQDVTADMNVYLRYARGFKSGTFNSGTVNNPPVNPEKIDSYEVGMKSYWLDRRLRVDAAAFFSNYENLQLQSYSNGVPELSNAAAARIKGLDFDTEYALTNALSLQLAGEFLDAKYTSFPGGTAYEKIPITQVNPAGGMGGWYAIPGGENFAGNYMVNASRVTLNAGLNYDLPTDIGEFLFAGVAQFRSRYYLEAQNAIHQPSNTLVNASIKWNIPNHAWYLQLWGNNLLNKQLIAGATYQSGLPSIMVPLAPRTYGINVGAHF